jgi:hypothetical protein
MSDTRTKPTRKARKTATPEIPADAIERRAYEKFVARGHAHGADFDDWQEAEEELANELAPRPTRAAKGTDAARPASKKRAAKTAEAPAGKTSARRKAQKA